MMGTSGYNNMSRIDIIGVNGNDGLVYEELHYVEVEPEDYDQDSEEELDFND